MTGNRWRLEPPPAPTVLPPSDVVAMPAVTAIADGDASSSSGQGLQSLEPPGLKLLHGSRSSWSVEALLARIATLEKRVSELEKFTKMPVEHTE